MGRSKETTGMQIWCIPEKKDTNKMYPGNKYVAMHQSNQLDRMQWFFKITAELKNLLVGLSLLYMF